MTHQDPPEENIVPPFEIPVGETDSFPANRVAFYGDFETDGVWSAGGMCCSADALRIPVALQQAIGEWGTVVRPARHLSRLASEKFVCIGR
ncbi:MAG: hypothetical protein IPM06_03875 [Rhizobiales bacterium]|nr:hypothetical protein [Hyphomicrobiales bacterium]